MTSAANADSQPCGNTAGSLPAPTDLITCTSCARSGRRDRARCQSVLIGYLDGADSHHEAARALLARVVDDDLGANPLTLAEVLVVARTGRLDTVLSVLRDIDVQALPFPTDTAVRLAELRADIGLKMPDCCVLLSAEEAGVDIASFDARLAQAAETRSLPVLPS